MKKDSIFKKLTMGVCYYPEHWDEALWDSDLRRMKEAGIELVRIGEFAWTIFEPEEGVFSFDFFDRFIEAARRHGLRVILGTPTATPPAWASHDYPEILNADISGTLYRHGARRHYNYNSVKYLQLTREIVTQLARHYGHNPAVAGWQIDNELNCELSEFYSESDTAAFRLFLRKKYGSLDALNRAWGAVFWNQTYTSWDQVFVPRHTINHTINPHQMLDYYRFISESACSYAKVQSDILRANISPDQFITTNGMFPNLDNHRMTRESLDFYTYDSYPDFAFQLTEDPLNSDTLGDRKWSRNLSETRCICPHFGIMEQQSGSPGWNTRMEASAPKPGQMTLWSMQSVAHGADYVSYFRWRTSTMGTEIYWHGILDYCGKENRRLREVRQITQKFDAIRDIAGAMYRASFAFVKDYDNVWDSQLDVWVNRVNKASEKGWFNASQLTHTPMDYLYLQDGTTLDELLRYPLLVYPHAAILTQPRAELLRQYVEAGGKLILGCRTGYKSITGQCCMDPMPGPARDICGAEVEDFTFVGPADEPVHIVWEGTVLDGAVFNDILSPLDGAEVLGVFDSNYYQGKPGLIRKKLGKGEAYYFGAAFDSQAAAVFLKRLGLTEAFSAWVDAPSGCELAMREKEGKRWLFTLNYGAHSEEIVLKVPMQEAFSGKVCTGTLTLPAYGTAVFLVPQP